MNSTFTSEKGLSSSDYDDFALALSSTPSKNANSRKRKSSLSSESSRASSVYVKPSRKKTIEKEIDNYKIELTHKTNKELIAELQNIIYTHSIIGDDQIKYVLKEILRKKADVILERMDNILTPNNTIIYNSTSPCNSKYNTEYLEHTNKQVENPTIEHTSKQDLYEVKSVIEERVADIQQAFDRINYFMAHQDEKISKIIETNKELFAASLTIPNILTSFNDLKSMMLSNKTAESERPNTVEEQNLDNVQKDAMSYSDAVKTPPLTLLIHPKESQTISDLKRNIDSIKTTAKITKIYYGKTAIKIRCSTNEDKNILEKELAEKFLNVKEAKPFIQKIIFYNIPDNLEDIEFSQHISKATNISNLAEIKFKSRIVSKKHEKFSHRVVEIPRKYSLELLRKGHFFIALQKFYVRKYISMRRCTKCQALDHTTKCCTFPNFLCCYCGFSHDNTINCRNKPPRCINCARSRLTNAIQHPANSIKCPTFLNKLNNGPIKRS